MSDIKPALSVDEWAAMRLPRAEWNDNMVHVNDEVARGLAIGGNTEILVVMCDWVPPSNSHGLAAALLYGQPYGFTWEMVDTIRDLVQYSREHAGWKQEPEAWHLPALAAADAIAALLPPR